MKFKFKPRSTIMAVSNFLLLPMCLPVTEADYRNKLLGLPYVEQSRWLEKANIMVRIDDDGYRFYQHWVD